MTSSFRFKNSRTVIWYIILFVFILNLSIRGAGANGQTPPEQRLKWYDQHVAMKEQSLFKHLKWQFLGPTNISGRMTDVAVVSPRGKSYTIYVAGASGGVWKSENEGTTWTPIFEHGPSTSIGDVTIAPSNQDIIWVGTGEANIFRSSMAGAGVFKSVDAGKSWTRMGLGGTHTIPRIVIHPQNPDIVYVAASGHEWTNNTDRGVYRSSNGGTTWEKILYIDEKTGTIDLVMDPADPNTLYAATWQRIRKKWNDPRNEPAYTGSGIYKTSDGGKSWKPINNGLPEAKFRGRIGIDVARSNPRVVYAFIDHYQVVRKFGGKDDTDAYGLPKMGVIRGATVYRSDDRGETWREASEANKFMEELSGTYGWVFGQIRVDPNNENKIYVMGVPLCVSEDGGKTFRILTGMHVDHHGLWIDPDNSNYLVNANDGGLAISYDGGQNWKTFTKNLPLVQFFNVAYDMAEPFHVYGSIQDHGSYRGVVDLGRGRYDIPAVEWEPAPGGEGSSHAIDPTDTNTVYAAGFYGNIIRTDMKSMKTVRIMPKADKGEPPLRGQWLAPFIISPHNPRIIYHGMNFLFRSLNRGDSWEKISPDLTFNDPDKIGDIQYQTLFAISESPLKFGLIYVGTDDGRVHVTRDSGLTWKEITNGLSPGRWISRIAASAFDEATVYVSQNGKRNDDFTAYLWKSTDYGTTWRNISANIPCGPVNVVREDPKSKNILYVGTDLGVYASVDGGKKWQVVPGNFPTTFVHDLVIHPRDRILVAATHGRGMYALDVSHLQQLTPQLLAGPVHLFETESTKLPRRGWRGWYGGREAHFSYYLKEAAEAKLFIKDGSGKTVGQIDGTGDVGLNTAVWDLKTMKKKDKKESPETPYVKPGTYTLVLKVGSLSRQGNFDVKK